MQRLLLAALFAAMFITMSSAPSRTDLCLGCLKLAFVERCCRIGPSSAREQHGEQHSSGGVCPFPRLPPLVLRGTRFGARKALGWRAETSATCDLPDSTSPRAQACACAVRVSSAQALSSKYVSNKGHTV